MSTNPGPGTEVTPVKLWFGCITSAVAWIALGCTDIVINWRACQHQENFGTPAPHPYVRLLIGLLGVAFFILSVWSGFVSYRNWQQLSAQKEQFMEAQAVERREFLSVLGVIITVTMGMGIVWLALTPIFLDICWRAR